MSLLQFFEKYFNNDSIVPYDIVMQLVLSELPCMTLSVK